MELKTQTHIHVHLTLGCPFVHAVIVFWKQCLISQGIKCFKKGRNTLSFFCDRDTDCYTRPKKNNNYLPTDADLTDI